MPIAASTLTVDTKPGKMVYASRGTVKPTIRAPAAYDNGMRQAVIWELRKFRAIYLLINGKTGILKLQRRATGRARVSWNTPCNQIVGCPTSNPIKLAFFKFLYWTVPTPDGGRLLGGFTHIGSWQYPLLGSHSRSRSEDESLPGGHR